MRNRTIQYGIDRETGLIVSRVNDEIAVPVLQWESMKPENNFKTSYQLEKFNVFDSIGMIIKWTRKIPIGLKNIHREFWGFTHLT